MKLVFSLCNGLNPGTLRALLPVLSLTAFLSSGHCTCELYQKASRANIHNSVLHFLVNSKFEDVFLYNFQSIKYVKTDCYSVHSQHTKRSDSKVNEN